MHIVLLLTEQQRFNVVFAARCMHKRGICCRAVCVWLDVTFVYCVETATDIDSYYGMRIGKHAQDFEPFSMSLSDL